MSPELITLLKQNRDLEEKLFYIPKGTDWQEQKITAEELSAAITTITPEIMKNRTKEISILSMIDSLESLNGRPIPAKEKSALQLVEILFNYFREYSNVDPQYYHVLNSLQIAFTRLSLNDVSFMDNQSHVAALIFEKLIKLGQHIDKNSGKLASYLANAIEVLISKIASRNQVSIKSFKTISHKLDEYFDSFNDKVSAKIDRIFEVIEKESRSAEADIYARQIIKNKTEGEEIPVYILEFYENHLEKALHQQINLHGTKSNQCNQILDDMDTLTWSITCYEGEDDYAEQFKIKVPDAMKRLHKLFESNDNIDPQISEFFALSEELQLKKLDGQRVNYDVVISSDIFEDENIEEHLAWLNEPNRNYEIKGLKEGNWYYLKIDKVKTQARLLSINDLTKQLIFINLSGDLIIKINFDGPDFLKHEIDPIIRHEVVNYDNAIVALIRELSTRKKILDTEYQAMTDQETQDKLRQKFYEEKARVAVKLKIEQEKQQQTLQRHDELREKARKLAREQHAEEEKVKERYFIKSIYKKLLPGTLIEFEESENKWKEASLSLISSVTQRYIFSDSRGNKVLNPTTDELLELIKNEKIKIIRQATDSAETMKNLVAARRSKLQNG